MKRKRVFSIILAVMLLFASTVAVTSCKGTGKTAAGEPDQGNRSGQSLDEDSTGSEGDKDGTLIMPSLEIDMDEIKEQLHGDKTGQGETGEQAGDDGEGQQAAGGNEGRQSGDGSEGQQVGDGSDSGGTEEGEAWVLTGSGFAGEKERKYIDVEWDPLNYEAKATPYKVEPDLSNVENAARFGDFTDKQLKMLSENGFVVIPADDEQLFFVYDSNLYNQIPNFITADTVLHAYHIFYNYSLRILESEYLLRDLEQLTGSMLRKSLALYRTLKDPEVKDAALKNTAYFAVAQLALGKELPPGIPDEALKLAEGEFSRISGASDSDDLPGFRAIPDYSQFTVRGHYTRREALGRYFKAMMWYGLFPFPPSDPETLQALLITYSLFTDLADPIGTSDIDLWENIYDPTVFYVGSADDLTVYQYRDLMVKCYGMNPDPETFADRTKLNAFLEEVKKLPRPLIQPQEGLSFRFMGQRYIPDSEILQNLCNDDRPIPKGLDVMGVLGSDRAYDILTNVYNVDSSWPFYPQEFKKEKEKFDSLSDETWRSNMYYGWLWVLKAFTEPFGEGWPSFMTGQAWQDKSLNTALASWAELRHDTILYGKQSVAECGDEGPGPSRPPVIKGYVEPNIRVYEKLLWLTEYSRENLAARNILPWDLKYKMENFEDLLRFLIDCSVRELRNEELTSMDYDRIQYFGGELESLISSFVEGGAWYEVISDTDRNMAVIADVHTYMANYLEEGVGPAFHIYVVVPIDGKLCLTRGAVFSYYEFISGARLTDEEWQSRLKENRQPPLPVWTESFIDIGGAEKTVPVLIDHGEPVL